MSTGPGHSNFTSVVAICRSALAAGVHVYLYCIDEGVRCVGTPEIQGLKQAGTNLFACAYGAHNRHIPVDDKAVYSGLTIVSDLVSGTDRFLAFN